MHICVRVCTWRARGELCLLSGRTCALKRRRAWWKSIFFLPDFPRFVSSSTSSFEAEWKDPIKREKLWVAASRCWQVVLHLLIEFVEKRQHRETRIHAWERKADLWQRWTWWSSSKVLRSWGTAVDHLFSLCVTHTHTQTLSNLLLSSGAVLHLQRS